ncbi:MAG TPA: pyridoxal phosphate-dependent aminotransferase [Candidatus Eremiobacteraceae bacterium]|nr:pyridoxal phosphate-dependent aminotransferase [Candidatus Eremiobacteraceae bacterium]
MSSANPRLVALPASGLRVVQHRMRPTSLDLSIGQPSLMPDTEPFETATQWIREHGCPYPPYNGIPELRAAIASIYGGRNHTKADNVCVTNGSQEAIYLAIKALLEPGRDGVLVVNPGYPSYARCCALEGIACRTVNAHARDGFRIRAHALLEALRPETRMIILGSPANPSGALLMQQDVDELARELTNRPGPPVIVVVDEVYRELTYGSQPYPSMADAYPNTYVVQSMSKSCALTGLRVGFLIGPEDGVSLATRAHMLMLMSVSVFSQRVALEIVRKPERLRAHVPWYVAQRAAMLEAAVAGDVQIIEPDGAFYTMVRLPDRWRSDSLGAAHALFDEQDVVTVPGFLFGSQAEGYLRVTWSADPASVREGFARIGRFVQA